MNSDPSRVILGFYSSEQVEAEKAYRTIAKTAVVRVRLFPGSGTKPHSAAEIRYAPLCLEGESLIVAETSSSNTQAVVKQLQNIGLPAVFVLRDDFTDLSSPVEPSATPRRWPRWDMLRRCGELFHRSGKSGPGRQTAGQPTSEGSRSLILVRLHESELELDAARRDLLEAVRLGHSMTAAADWLLDNAYLIRTQIAETRRHLPRHSRKLFSRTDARQTSPGAEDLAEQLVKDSDHALNETNIAECLRQYQTTTPLTIAELWFFPLLLRMALFESLAYLACRIRRTQQLREVAYLWANRLSLSMRRGPREFEQMLARLEAEPFAL